MRLVLPAKAVFACLLASCLGLTAVSAVPLEPRTPMLSGKVTDAIGNLIEGTELLFWSRSDAVQPVARSRSNADGEFRIADLAPGIYRFAALKDGYLTHVDQIDTRVRRWMGVVLRPSRLDPDSGLDPLPMNADWVLRSPRRNILREVSAVAHGIAPAADLARPTDDSLYVRLDHTFRVADSRSGIDRGASSPERTTGVEVGSAVGERGTVRMHGRHADVLSAGSEVPWGTGARSEAAQLQVDFAYEAGMDSQVAMTAFYNQRDLDWGGSAAEVSQANRQRASRSWGYETEWVRQLDAASRVAVQLDYRDSLTEYADLPHGLTLDGARPTTTGRNQRTVGAAGSYEALATADHQVQVGIRAQMVDAGRGDLVSRAFGASGGRESGFTVDIDARDTWFVSGPFSMSYGLGYRHAVTSAEASMLVPRLGGSWSSDLAVLSLLVSYHAISADEDFERMGAPGRSDDQLGYELQLEMPLFADLSLRGSTRFDPLEFDYEDGGGFDPFAADRVRYLSDGTVTRSENRLALVREAGGTRTFLEFVSGSADGRLAVGVPFEAPLPFLADRRLRFREGRLGVQLAPTGTHLQIDYRRMVETAGFADVSTARDANRQSLELSLMQDLLRDRGFGNWRLLMAMRLASDDSGEQPGAATVAAGDPSGEIHRRVSAGVSVLF